jgi:argininosuccinate lyase
LRLADDLVGSSSMTPQKRNPFLLEHVQGRATAALGAFTAAASAM